MNTHPLSLTKKSVEAHHITVTHEEGVIDEGVLR